MFTFVFFTGDHVKHTFWNTKKRCLIIVLDFHKMSKKKDFVCVGNILQTYKDFPSG